MNHAREQSVCPDLSAAESREAARLPKMVIHFAVIPGQTVSLRLGADAEVRVSTSHIWLTRIFSPYDYWLRPGDVIRLQRGERVWFSSESGEVAEVTLTSQYIERRHPLSRWIARWAEQLFDLSAVRSR